MQSLFNFYIWALIAQTQYQVTKTEQIDGDLIIQFISVYLGSISSHDPAVLSESSVLQTVQCIY